MDASALVKLVAHEPESAAVRALARGRHLVATELAEVEARRAVRRRDARLEPTLLQALLAVQLVPIDDQVRRLAASVGPPLLRTLDAIHLATALLVESIDEFVSYDDRLVDAARDRGLSVLSPA